MAFPVAVQSAVFYFLACTPCMSARNRYRTRQRARREREERARLDDEEPQLYRHPSPFNVNPYWNEEIMMGPSLPKKGRQANNHNNNNGNNNGSSNKTPSQQKLASAGNDGSIGTHSSLAVSNSGGTGGGGAEGTGGAEVADNNAAGATAASAIDSPSTTAAAAAALDMSQPVPNPPMTVQGPPPASPTLVPEDYHSINMVETTASNTTASVEGWNHKRYQREDEELWGSEPSRTHKLMDAIAKASSSAGRLFESTLGKERQQVTDEDRAKFYSPAPIIHPPVNEYHPPVVASRPVHKDALRWMLQPPPPAKVMEGKVPVSRSTSVASSVGGGAGGGRRSAGAGSEASLTRRLAMEARLRRADSSNSAMTHATRAETPSSTTTEKGFSAFGNGNGSRNQLSEIGPSNSPAKTQSAGLSASTAAGGLRPKSQQTRASGRGRNRSRSRSFASSRGDRGSASSDDEAVAIARWRFPLPSVPMTTTTIGGGTNTPTLALETSPTLTAFQTTSAAGESDTAQGPVRPKLETIVSSDVSMADIAPPDVITEATAARLNAERKAQSLVDAASTTENSNKGGLINETARSTGSSIDSGLALSS